MKRSITALTLALLTLVAACGDSTGTTDTTDTTSTTDQPTSTTDQPTDATDPVEAAAKWDRIANDRPIVSGEPTEPDNVIVDPDDPNVLLVRFLGGDPNCTAATAQVTSIDEQTIELTFTVGITDDALSRSCVAGEFNLEVAVDVGEPVGDRLISVN